MSDHIPNPQDGVRPTKKADFLLLALLLASLMLNVYLGWSVAGSKNGSAVRARPSELAEGAVVQPITVSDLSGKQETISFTDGGKPTVLYVLSPACKWCERNMQNIKTLAGPHGEAFRFIGLSLDEKNLNEYVAGNHFTFPVYKNPTPDTVRALGLESTPQTIVVSPEGRVLKSWVGAYGDRLRPEVEAYFGMKLPGLTPGDDGANVSTATRSRAR
jgi:AhpC/TSA family